MQDDLTHYKQRTVQITTKEPSGALPPEHSLRSSLASFGEIWHFHPFSTVDPGSDTASPNTAIVVFRSQAAVKHTLDSSRHESDESFWRRDSLKAHTVKKSGPLYYTYLAEIIPKLKQESHVPSSGSDGPSRLSEDRPKSSILDDCEPPLKRPRAENWGVTSEGANAGTSHAPTSKSSSIIPESAEWMRARITQLEAELTAAQAARDMSISEQDVLRAAHEAEQRARREAMLQKSAAEAALSQAEVEKDRLRAALGATLSVELNDTESSYATAPDWAQELSPKTLQVGDPQTALGTVQLDGAEAIRLSSEVKQFKYELVVTKEQLGSTQRSLESLEQKHSLTLKEYESTKKELETYKSRLENEQTLMKNLKATLIPQVYNSLRTNQGILAAFLSATGEPPVSEQERFTPKEEAFH